MAVGPFPNGQSIKTSYPLANFGQAPMRRPSSSEGIHARNPPFSPGMFSLPKPPPSFVGQQTRPFGPQLGMFYPPPPTYVGYRPLL
jgi:hypothetical protein